MDLPLPASGNGTISATAAAELPNFPHALPARPARRCSSRLLAELLAMNEEMIEQLHLERLSETGTAGFLTKMIEQHEKAAVLLRTQLASPASA
ncbi:hypothetical protein [Opitutus sp. GAS368]|uniref:hypothetical protein n=1 Tax=Opitutus sp. GAS368 TaxID=1882749 RepID=UPI00087CAE62|nr:hypothetical protein [Opitutus sp. GAS368]SDS12820.1 hypothetical protein SAMN05444173_1968 [Opitutus sp. GAS368]